MDNFFYPHDSESRFPMDIINAIDARRTQNHNKFSSKEIFREEFLKFITTDLLQRYHQALDKATRGLHDEHREEISSLTKLNKDTYYIVNDLVRQVAELSKIVAQQQLTPLKAKSKTKTKK